MFYIFIYLISIVFPMRSLLHALLLGLALPSASLQAQEQTTPRLEEQVDHKQLISPGLSLTLHPLDTRVIIAGIVNAYNTPNLNVEGLVDQGMTIMQADLAAAVEIPLGDPSVFGYGWTAMMYGGGLLAVSSTRFPGASLERDGDAVVQKRMHKEDSVPTSIPIDYVLGGELTTFTTAGRFSSAFWHGSEKIKVGARAEITVGGLLIHGTGTLGTTLRDSQLSLLHAKFETTSLGLVADGAAGPALQVYDVECSIGVGPRFDKIWFSIDGSYVAPDKNDSLRAEFSPTSLTYLGRVMCFYQIRK